MLDVMKKNGSNCWKNQSIRKPRQIRETSGVGVWEHDYARKLVEQR